MAYLGASMHGLVLLLINMLVNELFINNVQLLAAHCKAIGILTVNQIEKNDKAGLASYEK